MENYKCGADFLPSPLASKPRFALKANEVLTKTGLLTAVAVAVENDHTIAFLGNNQGEVFKVRCCLVDFFFSSPEPHILYSVFSQVHLTTESYVYSKTPGDTMGEKVNKNLFFDPSHLYVTTEKKVKVYHIL